MESRYERAVLNCNPLSTSWIDYDNILGQIATEDIVECVLLASQNHAPRFDTNLEQNGPSYGI